MKGNNREDEARVVSVGEVNGGSSNVRNMTCARDDESFGDTAHKEQCNVSLSHTREKFARVIACDVKCTIEMKKIQPFLMCPSRRSRVRSCDMT